MRAALQLSDTEDTHTGGADGESNKDEHTPGEGQQNQVRNKQETQTNRKRNKQTNTQHKWERNKTKKANDKPSFNEHPLWTINNSEKNVMGKRLKG